MSCWVNTTLQMAYKSTGGWNGSDRRCRRCVVGRIYFAVFSCVGVHFVTFGVIVISWVCRCFFFFFCCFFFFFLYRGGACFIEREVVVGEGFWALWTPRLEWLAWLLAWFLEFVGLSRWLP